MTNVQAALGVAQMERIDEFIRIKRRLGAYYREKLSTLEGVKCQVEKSWAKTVYWMYCIELDMKLGLTAEVMMTRLGKMGIGTRPFFLGLHEQPALHDLGLFKGERYPVTEQIARQGLYLPSGLTLTEHEVDEVVDAVKAVLADRKGR
jgi:perosamine synthetase